MFQGFCFGLFVLTILICYPIVVICYLLKFLIFDLVAFFIWSYHDVKVFKELLPTIICGFLLRLPVFVISIFFTGMASISVLSIVASLTLNAELLNRCIAPILSVVAYFWKNWRWSVEAKCVQLKTLIIEISRDKVAATKDQQNQDMTFVHFCVHVCQILIKENQKIHVSLLLWKRKATNGRAPVSSTV